jgi:competence protein ComEA
MFRRLFLFLGLTFALMMPAWASVDINTAGAAELEGLPGIGPSKAAAIIEYRSSHGPFSSVDQLDDVPGIGPSTMANLRPLVVVGEAKGGAKGGKRAEDSEAPAEEAPAEAAPPASSGGRVNINTATAADLDQLPGIGPSKAAAIFADREQNGPFSSCDDLGRVQGIGASTLANLRDACTTGD